MHAVIFVYLHLLSKQVSVVLESLSLHWEEDVQDLQPEIGVYEQVLFKHKLFVHGLPLSHSESNVQFLQSDIGVYKHLP
jgi:hypothetical protein